MQILIQLFHILVFPGLLFDVAMGVLLMGLNNKLVARMQNRVGPPILQPWYDFLKCCGKETIVPARAKRAVFLGAPFLGFVLLISVSMFIPFAGFVPAAMGSDLVVILYLLTFVSVCEILGAASSGSPFAGVGLSREMVAMISYELPFVLVILTVARAAGADQPSGAVFSREGVLAFQEMNGPLLFSPAIIPAAIAMLFVIPCETGMHPFDIAEAETEICEGMLAEYSGAPLAMYRLTHMVKVYTMSSLFVAMFLGNRFTGIVPVDILIGILLCIAVMFISTALPHAICARLKVEQVFHFYWTFVTGFALAGLLLVWAGV